MERSRAPKRRIGMSSGPAATLVGAVLLSILSACGEPSSAPAACADVVQFEGRTYFARDTVPRQDPSENTAIRGVCQDVDPAEGVAFPADGDTVQISLFEGFDADAVIGAEGDDGEFYVYFTRDVSERQAEKIVTHLNAG